MEKKHFLDLDGNEIQLHLEDGEWWIVASTVAAAFEADWRSQQRVLRGDAYLKDKVKLKSIFVDGQFRNKLCIREEHVYGWIFMINVNNPRLLHYKWKCNEILYKHFRGTFTERRQVLSEMTATEKQIEELEQKIEEKMSQMEEYQQLKLLKNSKRKHARELTKLDQVIIQQQMDLGFSGPGLAVGELKRKEDN